MYLIQHVEVVISLVPCSVFFNLSTNKFNY